MHSLERLKRVATEKFLSGSKIENSKVVRSSQKPMKFQATFLSSIVSQYVNISQIEHRRPNKTRSKSKEWEKKYGVMNSESVARCFLLSWQFPVGGAHGKKSWRVNFDDRCGVKRWKIFNWNTETFFHIFQSRKRLTTLQKVTTTYKPMKMSTQRLCLRSRQLMQPQAPASVHNSQTWTRSTGSSWSRRATWSIWGVKLKVIRSRRLNGLKMGSRSRGKWAKCSTRSGR